MLGVGQRQVVEAALAVGLLGCGDPLGQVEQLAEELDGGLGLVHLVAAQPLQALGEQRDTNALKSAASTGPRRLLAASQRRASSSR